MKSLSSLRFRSGVALVLASIMTMASVGCAANEVEQGSAETESALLGPAEMTAVADSNGTVTLHDRKGAVLFSQQAESLGDAAEGFDERGRPTITVGDETLTILESVENTNGSTRVLVQRGDGSKFSFDSQTKGSDRSGISPRTPVHVVIAVVVVIVVIVSFFSYQGCRSDLLDAQLICVQSGGLPGGSCTSNAWGAPFSWTMTSTCTPKNGGGPKAEKDAAEAE